MKLNAGSEDRLTFRKSSLAAPVQYVGEQPLIDCIEASVSPKMQKKLQALLPFRPLQGSAGSGQSAKDTDLADAGENTSFGSFHPFGRFRSDLPACSVRIASGQKAGRLSGKGVL